MKALVTGGAGFIGSHLVDRLLRDGFEVRILDNFSTGRRSNLHHVANEVELVEGDVRSYERANTAVRNCDIVFHQAALPSVPRSIQDPLTTNSVNVVGTLNLLLAARDSDVEWFVAASSSSVYGPLDAAVKSEDLLPKPISPYAVGKLAAEGYCRTFHEVYDLPTVCLRYFNVFGPRQDPRSQYAAVIPSFISAGLQGAPAVVYGDGNQSRDFTYIDNIVDANLLAHHRADAAGEVVNVACGSSITINEVLHTLEEVCGLSVRAENEPARAGEVRHSRADVTRAKSLLTYSPTVSFVEGLKRTVDHLAEELGAMSASPTLP